MAARTKFFDEFFADAAAAGVRQAVILASGLDARGYRLTWPADMVLYEIDQPDVIAFKRQTLAGLGAEPRTDLRTVAIDLREDWARALAEAGFDANRPTAWIAEGLMGYLPPEAQDRLLDQIGELSAPGSRLAVEAVPSQQEADQQEARERMQASTDQWREHGFDLEFSELVFFGERADVVEYLSGHGWTAHGTPANDLLRRYGLTPIDAEQGFADVSYVSASK